jgi:hypothetical protein
MKPGLQRLLKDLSRAVDALAYAHVGEFLPLRDMDAVLRGGKAEQPPCAHSIASPPQPRRRVALAAERALDIPTLRYAFDVCLRLDADLELFIGPDVAEVEERIEEVRQDRALNTRVVRLGESFIGDLARYAWTRSGLVFVVTAAEEGLAERILTPSATHPSVAGQVPVVVVSEGRDAA